MNSEKYKSMSEEQAKLVFTVLLAIKEDQENFNNIYEKEIKKKDYISQILEKRIEVCKLPRFEPSAIFMISTLAEGNPGRAVLMLIETLEKYKEGKIDINFISTYVYPYGFYNDKEFEKIFEQKRSKHDEGYNWLI